MKSNYDLKLKVYEDCILEIEETDFLGRSIFQTLNLKEEMVKDTLSSLGYVRTKVGNYRFKGYSTKHKKLVYGKHPWFWDKEDSSCLNLKEFWVRVYTGEIIDPVMVDVED